jgi:hypothetical protein
MERKPEHELPHGDWIACNERLPRHNQMVAVLASHPSYPWLTPAAGWFEEKYYDTTINKFKLNCERWWECRVAYWMPLPYKPRDLPLPSDVGFDQLFEWEKSASPPRTTVAPE